MHILPVMDKKLAYSYIVIMGILSGFVIFSGRFFLDRGLSLLEVGFLPNLVALIVLAPLLFWMPMKRKLLWWYVLYGVIGCALVLAQFSPLVFGVPVALLVLLLYTQPLWTLLINYFFLKQPITRYDVFACVLVLLGVVFLVNPFNITVSFLGAIIALSGGILLSFWVLLGSALSKKGSPPVATKFGELFFSLLFLLGVMLIFRTSQAFRLSFNHSISTWSWIILMGVIVYVLAQVLFYQGLKIVPSTHAGIILLLEPVSAAILASIFLGEAITLGLIVGGILILIANAIVILQSEKK